ncbi:MAG: PAS domain-containing protein [Bacteroidota bacterium]|nr:PAS domain-containing protein [Bacteroidota bacterium]
MKPKLIIAKKSPINKTSSPVPKVTAGQSFPIVAIGASAGGLEAITQLLQNLPPDTGMGFVYVQHLSPDHKSILTNLLARTTLMKVHEVKNNMVILQNNLYVIPPDKEMAMEDGHIKLSPRSKERVLNLPIDNFFSSLAENYKEYAIGIILSGSARDGTQGMKAIKQEGGLTFAQDASAKFSSMPKSAIAEGVVDFILSPKEIALEISRLSKHPFLKSNHSKTHKEDLIDDNDPHLKIILNHLHKAARVDFSMYKMATIKRRILRRMMLYKIKTISEYAKLLGEKNNDIDILYQDLLINVTSFFRDTETHKYLKTTLLPKLLKNKKPSESLRIWIPACSSGEEAYSIAMMLLEIQGNKAGNPRIQIFASDLSAKSISKARIGEYSKQELAAVSPKRIQQFYIKSGPNYRISKTVRDMCVFAPHNILYDPPFSRIDFISCCNLFIYLDTAAQKKALTTFHYALNDVGYLMLGKSESVGSSTQLFTSLHKKFKIFVRKKNPGVRSLPALSPRQSPSVEPEKDPVDSVQKLAPVKVRDLESAIDTVIISEFMPSSVVINYEMEIIQFRGATDTYLTHAQGKATFNILKKVRPEIAFELRNAISSAIKTKNRIHKSGIEMKQNAGIHIISIEVVPLKIEWDEPLLLILFTDHRQVVLSSNESSPGKNNSTAKDGKIKKLEDELVAAKNEMYAFVQKQEAATEELQSANEEVVSSNEELQTVNEELETSKEEIESTNEELTTTNQELQTRNELLHESYEYAEAIIATINEPMIILDKNLCIKSANKSFYKNFDLKEEETEGIRLYDLGNKQWNIPRLRDLLEDIIPKNSFLKDFEFTHSFPGLGEKTLLLNANRIIQETHQEHLILLAITDITQTVLLQLREKDLLSSQVDAQTKIAEASMAADAYIRNVFMQTPALICMLRGPNHEIVLANERYLNIVGHGDIIGKPIREAMPEKKGQGFFEIFDKVYKTGESFIGTEEPLMVDKGGGMLVSGFYNFVYQASLDVNGKVNGILVHGIEVTDQILARKKIEESEYFLQNILEGLPQLAWRSQPDGKHIYFNKRWYAYTGQTEEEAMNEGWANALHAEDRERAFPLWKKTLEKKRALEVEYRLKSKDGYYLWFLARAEPFFDAENNVIAFIGTCTDIHEQKQAEEAERRARKHFHFIADAMPQKVWTADSDGNMNYFNACWFAYTGLSYEVLKDWGWKQIIHPDDWATNKIRWQHSIDTGNNFELEHRILNSAGKYKWHLSRGLAQKDENGKIIMWIGTNTEIQEQKTYNVELEDAVVKRTYELLETKNTLEFKNEKLVQINKELESFAYVSSHDLQEPLRKIQTFASLILEKESKNLSTKGKDYVQRMQSGANRMQKLIEDLISYSSTNITERKFIKTDLNKIIEDVKIELKDIIDEKHASIDATELCPVVVIRFQFHQLMHNLLSNALKFSNPKHRPHIIIKSKIIKGTKIKTQNLSPEKSYCHISISDNGIGFEPEFKDKIFEVFQKLHSKDEYAGTGIGLSIVKKIVENHQGIIAATSDFNKGATFDIYIPEKQ